MEVEFLSNMRYNLLASKDEWEEWLDKLACFHEYYVRASRLPASPLLIPSPSHKGFNSPIPSPIGTTLSSSVLEAAPFTPTGNAVTTFSPSSSHSQTWAAAYQANAVSPLASKPSMNLPVSRKRGPEHDPIEHPAKRQMPPRMGHVVPPVMSLRPTGLTDSARLPIPHLTVVTNHQVPNTAVHYPSTNGYSQSVASAPNVVSLPPLQPGMRAMSSVYQPSPTSALPQPCPSVPSTASLATMGYPATAMPSHQPINYGTPSKRRSPVSLASYVSSPMVDPPYNPGSAIHTPIAHTPISHSPSVYLQQRASPYKPIRHVNRLLHPPPSASLDQYHLAVPVQPTQMHYQPLGRRNDLRTGVVPEFVIYNRGQHHTHPLSSHIGSQGHYAP